MSLINVDSFAHYTNILQKYAAGSNAVITAGVGRHGLSGIVTNGTTFFLDDLVLYGQSLRLSGVVHGIAFKCTALPGSEVVLFQYRQSDNTIQVTVTLTTTGHLKAYKGSPAGTLLATSADPLAIDIYYYIESKVFIDDVTGTVKIHLWSNQTTMTTPIDFTGDTKNGGTGLISKISYGITASSPHANWSDKYTCDLVGASFSDFQGNKSIGVLLPSGAGFFATWLPSPNVANYLNVNNNPPNASKFNHAPSPPFAVVERVYSEVQTPTTGTCTFTPGPGTLQNGDRIFFYMLVDGGFSGTWIGAFPVGNSVVQSFLDLGGVFGPGVATVGVGPPPATFTFTYTGPNPTCIMVAYRGVDLFDPIYNNESGFPVFSNSYNCPGTPIDGSDHCIITTYSANAILLAFSTRGLTGDPYPTGTPVFASGFTQFGQVGSAVTQIAVAEKPLAAISAYDISPFAVWTPENCSKSVLALALRPAAIVAPTYDLFVAQDTVDPTINAVVVNLCANFNGANEHNVGAESKLSTNSVNSYGVIPGAAYRFQQTHLLTAPGGAAWNQARLNATEFGYRIDNNAPPIPVLTVASLSPASGVAITVAPNDNNGDSNGSTPFTREYNLETPVTLTAPATASGNPFAKWKKDGVDYALTEITSLAMDTSHSMQAVYTASACPSGTVIIDLDGSLLSQGDGTEITSWTDAGIHAYPYVPFGGGITGPLYDTTPANNILYGVKGGGEIDRGMKFDGPVNVDLGLPGAFTMIFVILTEGVAAGLNPTGTVFAIDDGGTNGYAVGVSSFGNNYALQLDSYTPVGEAGIFSNNSYPATSPQKLIVTIMCDGVNVRMMVNGLQLAGVEWFNFVDSSNTYVPSGTTVAAKTATGVNTSGSQPFFGQVPFFKIINTNLSDALRQAIESAQAALYGVSYTAGSCSIGCV